MDSTEAQRRHLIEAHSLLSRADIDLRLAQERCVEGGIPVGVTFGLRRAIDQVANAMQIVEDQAARLEDLEPIADGIERLGDQPQGGSL